MINRIKHYLKGLSFRTGVIVLSFCIPLYILSIAQALLPIGAVWKGVLWFLLFGLAKTAQYAGIFILGAEGIKRLHKWMKDKTKSSS